MRRPSVPVLALTADAVAVVVFAAIGRSSHAEADSVVGLVGTAAPFLVGLGASWASRRVRADPPGLRAGAVVLLGTVVIGLALRAAFLQRLPLSFAIVATISLAVLLLGWRGLSMLVARVSTKRGALRH
ncbi:MAG: rane protein [Pseudonocardia sp.]|uniref:DUF3054 domain-containing protein n=1 Tax=Pseudonocardia sp. TaxID=60912 RepID=UPI002620A1C1|nr:DUF3054 domain-containing protein [Pseudonocardia sp.]MCU1631150.1 rane protein [Pseudonocardia sp.]MDT7698683.1 hypothetical protein [Pseudonocardiales bacterium]HEV7469904.1 DUF3054 domain-containing protein [Pseudonocardia sp.]